MENSNDEELEGGRVIWLQDPDEIMNAALLHARAQVPDIPLPATQSTSSAKSLFVRAQLQEQCGAEGSHTIHRRSVRRNRLHSSSRSATQSSSSASEPPSAATKVTSTHLQALLDTVQANAAMRSERRAERQRRELTAQMANEELRRKAQDRVGMARNTRGLLSTRSEGNTLMGQPDGQDENGTLNQPSIPIKDTIQQTRSLTSLEEPLKSVLLPSTTHNTNRTPESRKSQTSWGGGVKPCGLTNSSGFRKPAPIRNAKPYPVATIKRSSQEHSDPSSSLGGKIHHPFKPPSIVAKTASNYSFKRPSAKPLSRGWPSTTTSNSTSSSIMDSTEIESPDSGNDSFDDGMEGLFMSGGEDVAAFLRLCDGQ